MTDFEETFRQEFAENLNMAFRRVEDDWLHDHLFGDETGEPLGILDMPGITIKSEEPR